MGSNLILTIWIRARNDALTAMRALGASGLAAINPLTASAAVLAAAVGGVAVASVAAATGFDQAMHKVAGLTSLIQTSGHDMAWWEQQLLALAPNIDVSATDLAKALYFVASAGIPANQVISVLTYSAKAAAATMGDMSQVADLVTSAMNAYKNQGMDAATATNVIVDAVKNGKVEMHALETSFAFVAVSGLSAKFSLQEVAAAVSTLTKVSGNTAARRIQMDLDNLIRSLGDVGTVAKHAAALGLPFDEAKFASEGLIDRLQSLMQMSGFTTQTLDQMRAAAGGNEQVFEQMALKAAQNSTAFKSLVGGAAAMIPAVILMNDKGATFNQIYAEMSDKTDKVSAAFDVMRQSTGQQIKMFETAVNSLAITLGLKLLPAVNKVVTAARMLVLGLVAWTTSVANSDQLKTFLIGLAFVLTAILAPALIGIVASAAPLVLGMLLILGAAKVLGPKIDDLAKSMGGWHQVLKDVRDRASDLGDKIQQVSGWMQQHHDVVVAVSTAITLYFVPALLLAAAKAVFAGGVIIAKFVWSLILSGAQAYQAAAQVAWFILELIATAAEAALTATVLVASLVWALVQTGAKMAATAVVAAVQFIPELISMAAEAALTGIALGINLVEDVAGFAAALIATAIPALIAVAVAFWGWVTAIAASTVAMLTNPIGLIITGVVLLIIGLVLLVTHWTQVTTAVQKAWNSLGQFHLAIVLLAGPLAWLIAIIVLLIQHWGDLTSALGNFKDFVLSHLGDGMAAVGSLLQNIGKGIASSFEQVLNDAIDQINNFTQRINQVSIGIPAVHIGPVNTDAYTWTPFSIPAIPHVGLASGGLIARAGWAVVGERGAEYVHLNAGNRVYSNSSSQALSAAFRGSAPIGGGNGNSGGGTLTTFNYNFPGVTDAAQVERIIRGVQQRDYSAGRAPGAYGGNRAGIGGK